MSNLDLPVPWDDWGKVGNQSHNKYVVIVNFVVVVA